MNIEELLRRLRVQRVRRRGREWWALCPFHEDTKPTNWSIQDNPGHPRHGHHHCFACGMGGTPRDLVCAALGVSDLRYADRWLERNGFSDDLPKAFDLEVRETRVSPEPGIRAPWGVKGIGNFEAWPSRVRGFGIRRGLDAAQVRRWRIGYAVDGKLGGRIFIPVEDENGRLQNYTARAFDGSSLRYRSGSLDEGADPGAVFGARWWPEARADLYLTEGALNALACERAGLAPVASLDGSQLHAKQAATLSTFRHLIVLADPDDAGSKLVASLRPLSRWIKMTVVELPDGADANDLEREGTLAETVSRTLDEAAA